jgi:predicted aspartyl protease
VQFPLRLILVAFILLPLDGLADAPIPLTEGGASTLYVDVAVNGAGTRAFLVDTGSSYTSIDPGTLDALEARGMATFVRRVGGTMADGSRRYVSIYAIDGVTVGDRCHLDDVKVAVLPGRERPILGVNVLRRLAPITVSIDPPALEPGQCREAISAKSSPGSPESP